MEGATPTLDSHKTAFYGLLLEMLLVAAGIEPNPGPNSEASCEFCGKLLMELLSDLQVLQKSLAEQEQFLKGVSDQLDVLKNELSVKEMLLTEKIKLFNLTVDESHFHDYDQHIAEREGAMNELSDTDPDPDEVTIAATPEDLYEAVCKGKLLIAQGILRTGKVSVEHRFEDRKTALLLAAEHGQLPIVCFLTQEAGACKEACDNTCGMTALHWAFQGHHYEVVQYLAKEAGMSRTYLNLEGETVLHLASRAGKWNIVRFLIKKCNLNPASLNSKKETALHIVSSLGDLDMARFLVKECNVGTACVTCEGETALHVASRTGQLKIVHFLVKECNVNAACLTSSGRTALHKASRNGHLKIVRFLVEECNMNIHSKDSYGYNAIHIAAREGYLHVVEYLCERSGNVPIGVANYGRTALHLAALENHLDVVMYLVNSGKVDKKAKNSDGETAVEFAPSYSAVRSFLSS